MQLKKGCLCDRAMRPPSTRLLASLPGIEPTRRVSQSIAMLDAILSPEWEYRYYSYNADWNPGEQMASMRNGSGDEYFILFTAAGAAIKGFDHEAAMSPCRVDPPQLWPGLYDHVPDVFATFLYEPAFSMRDVTFCIWRTSHDTVWRCGVTDFPDDDDPDGSEWMLHILDGQPATYHAFAAEYYENDVPLEAIAAVYQHRRLTDDIVRPLNPDLCVQDLVADAKEIGYPNVAG